MKTYTFEKSFSQGWVIINVKAENYSEALAALIFQVGSESNAAKYTLIYSK